MKPNKALRRLTKIEASMSDVLKRYVSLAPAVRKALRDVMSAVTVGKVSLDASSGTATNPPVKRPGAALRSSETPDGKSKGESRMRFRKSLFKEGWTGKVEEACAGPEDVN
jgi:hypothetical protein